MDKFVVRFKTSEEALPLVWKTSPLPKSQPKRPVGRPRKRPLNSEDIHETSSAKRICTVDSNPVSVPSTSTPICVSLDSNSPSDQSESTPISVQSDSNTPSAQPKSSTTSVPSESTPLNVQSDSNSPSAQSESVPISDHSDSTTTSVQLDLNPTSAQSVSDSPSIRGNYKHFTLKQKLNVTEFAKLHGIRKAAKQFKIPRSTVMTWSKTDFTSIVRDKKGALPKSGRPLTYPEELDTKILEYVLEERDLQNSVSIQDILGYASDLIKPVSPGFSASRQWATGFMKRHDLSLRAKTSLSQRLPKDLEDKLKSFHEFVVARREEDEFDEHLIINMDETPVYFDLQPAKTVNQRGAKSVLIRTTGSEKRHFTVVLAVSARGDVLPPMVIFKGKRELKIPTPPGWIVTVQEKGWMDENMMIRWIKDIYLKYTHKERSLCVLDSFRGHLTDRVKREFRKGNTVMAVIPGGCTSKVQPLDVSINKPFKGELRQSWGSYMRVASRTAREKGERVKAATKQEVIGWLESAVNFIIEKPEMVWYSFLVCGISNALDGSQNDLIRKDIPVERRSCAADSDSESEFEGFDEDDIPDIVTSLDNLEQ